MVKSEMQPEKNNTLLIGEKQLEWQWIYDQKPGGQREVAQCFPVLKEKNCQPSILYPVKISVFQE